jgi:hypothetical protein
LKLTWRNMVNLYSDYTFDSCIQYSPFPRRPGYSWAVLRISSVFQYPSEAQCVYLHVHIGLRILPWKICQLRGKLNFSNIHMPLCSETSISPNFQTCKRIY